MKDRIEVVSFDITYKCNLRCLHCYNSSGTHNFDTELSDNEVINIVSELSKLKPRSLCFCGGEPLMRKELLYKSIDLYNKSSPIIGCNMVSNGLLVNYNAAEKLKESGLNNIQISLDGFSAESHNWIRQNNLAHVKAIEALKILKEVNIDTSVACAPSKKNFYEIHDLIDLCLDLGVKNFRMQPMMDIGRGKNIKNFMLNTSEYLMLTRKLKRLAMQYKKKGMVLDWGDPINHLIDISDQKGSMYFIHITAYGDLMISPYIPIKLGSLKKHSLTEYIEAGLLDMYKNELISLVAGLFSSASDMQLNLKSSLPEIFTGNDIVLDVIEDDVKKKTQKLLHEIITKERVSV
jgi:Predicted Fe-S oxidoreductases